MVAVPGFYFWSVSLICSSINLLLAADPSTVDIFFIFQGYNFHSCRLFINVNASLLIRYFLISYVFSFIAQMIPTTVPPSTTISFQISSNDSRTDFSHKIF